MVVSLTASLSGETSHIAIGDIVGSIGRIDGIVSPMNVPSGMIVTGFLPMLGFTLLVALFAWPKPNTIKRWEATILLTLFLSYTVWLVLYST